MDRTFSRDFSARSICAQTASLSPFTVALRQAAPPSQPSSPQIVATKVLSRDAKTQEIVAQVSVSNIGGVAANGMQLTVCSINNTAGSPLPQVLGTIAPAGAVNATLRFPPSAGAAGSAAVLTIGGTYTGGSFSTQARVTLP